jgi:hypothetical protein
MAFQNNLPKFGDRTISDFKSIFTGGGVRSNLFEVEVAFPKALKDIGIEVDSDYRFLIKSANLPGSTLTPISVPFRGRQLKLAGDRIFDPWTITVINDTNFKIRNAFEQWMNLMNKHDDNAGIINPSSYQSDMKVHQLSRGNTKGDTMPTAEEMPVLRSYKLYGTFPTAVSPIDLSYDITDTIQEFTVTLEVQWWDALSPTDGKSLLGLTES